MLPRDERLGFQDGARDFRNVPSERIPLVDDAFGVRRRWVYILTVNREKGQQNKALDEA